MVKTYRTAGQLNLFADLEPKEKLPENIIINRDNNFETKALLFLKKIAAKSSATVVIDLETSSYLTKGMKNGELRSPRLVKREDALDKNALNPFRLSVRLIQIEFEATVLIFDTWLDDFPNLLRSIKNLWESDRVTKIAHNAIFDLNAARCDLGWIAKNFKCTRILSNMVYAGFKYHGHSLKEACERELGIKMDKAEGAGDWGVLSPMTMSQIKYAATDVINTRKLYQALIEKLHKLDREIPTNYVMPIFTAQEIYEIHCGALPGFAEITYNGLPVDVVLAKQYIKQWETHVNKVAKPALEWLSKDGYNYTLTTQPAKLAARIHELTGIWLIKEALDDAITEDELTQLIETDLFGNKIYQKTLSSLSAKAHELKNIESAHPELGRFVAAKSMLRQVDFLKRCIECQEYNEPRLRGNINPLGSVGSGRSTMGSGGWQRKSAGNQQNVPKHPENKYMDKSLPKVRGVIRTKYNWKLVVADSDSSHVRWVTSICHCPGLLAILNDPIKAKLQHCYLASDASKLMGECISPEDIDKFRKDAEHPKAALAEKLRAISKCLFYSALNAASSISIQASLAKAGIIVDIESVDQVYDAWRKMYPGVVEWQKKIKDRILKTGVRSTEKYDRVDGTYFKIPQIRFKTCDGRLFAAELHKREYTDKKTDKTIISYSPKAGDGTSSSVLSPEAIAFNIAIKEVHEKIQNIKSYRENIRLVLFCHDELALEARGRYALDAAYIVNKAISDAYDRILRGVIPSGVDMAMPALHASVASNYADAK